MVEQKSKRKKAKFPHLKNGSFFLHIFYSFIVGGLIPAIFLSILLGLLSVQILSTAFKNQTDEAISKASLLTEELFKSIEATALFIATHKDVLTWAESEKNDPNKILAVNKLISEVIDSPYIQAYLLPLDGSDTISRRQIPEEYKKELYENWGLLGALSKIRTEEAEPVFYSLPHYNMQTPVSFAVGYPIFSKSLPIAYLILDVERDELSQRVGLAAFSSGFISDLFLIDKTNTILYSVNDAIKEGSFYEPKEDVSFFSLDKHLSHDLRLIASYPLYTVHYFTQKMKNASFFVVFVSFFLFLMMAILLSRSIAYPIQMLTKTMKDVSYGNLDIRCDVKFTKNAEMRFLIESYNYSLDQIRELYHNRIAQERSLRHAQVQALQAQINPHFLNNTLNSIKSMALLEGNKDVADMITSLARIFRQSISISSEFTNLADSIAIAKDYFTIEAKRWPGRFTLTENIEGELYDAVLPHLVLQPIFENALMHGLEKKEGSGNIWLRTWLCGGDLFIEVKDDGIGIKKETLKKIQKKLDEARLHPELISDLQTKTNMSGSSGIALINTHRRLSLIFGKTYGLQIESQENFGTKVLICLPYKKEGSLV